jgi:predicted metal-dependent hydrolase
MLSEVANKESVSHQDSDKSAKIPITPRKMNFPFEKVEDKYWFGGNPIITVFFTTLSATFPAGEKTFIDAVNPFRAKVTDPSCQQQIKGFIGQEAQHCIQHSKLNLVFDELGLFASEVEDSLTRRLIKIKSRQSPEEYLASTASLEHITAIIGEYLLENIEIMEPASKEIKDLFIWHSMEEIEHKSVVFNLFMNCVNDRKLLKKMMRKQTAGFFYRQTIFFWKVIFQLRKIPSFSEMIVAFRFFWGRKGLFRKLVKPYLRFYKKDFHPNNTDTLPLLTLWGESVTEWESE